MFSDESNESSEQNKPCGCDHACKEHGEPCDHEESEHKSGCCNGHGQGHQCGCGHHHGEGNGAQADQGSKSGIDFDNIPDYPLPAPSLISLVTGLAQQAMLSMGILPHPITGKVTFMFNQATHLIDTIALIFDKTAGNRSEEETKTIESVVHELRMMFLAAQEEKAKRDAQSGNVGK